ncbi:MAG: Uncharacterised protein [Candidatus Nitrosopelagicus brevis]|nr:MAG: Uncharacterised protein [Candidatus Nitrosopelagicus brevis]
MCFNTSFKTFSNLLKSASPTMSTGLRELPHGGITASIFFLISSIFAILIPSFEHASVEIIAGPPAFETITKSPFIGSGCFENAVA